ncbi:MULTISPECIES: TRAP transporter large permease [Haloferax]|uniref:Sialic acid TRAP transporter permease protein SiaT n=1 Tax=Haloferax massiliensis TaxID=1476858 RepID=A0A0D6JV66_9EURY|nr:MULTISPECIES: TRAP transporter large permease [Haloferax]MDS0243291.1 TRAP transporter large permease [Haloferax sp. S2CR25]MDS0446412.1 TRAP transporter large permease [Haloferax sp. S2CR25-2]CQR52717.1 Sialic acid TRAP transporter permease protein SiaT [Haloferax massiliensis]
MADVVLLGLFIGVLLVLYLFEVPVVYALGLTSLILMWTTSIPFEPLLVAQTMVSGTNSFVLLAIPLFLQTGLLMNKLGLTDVIFDFAKAIVGPIRGGLAHVNIVASIIFSGMTGTAAADAAGLGAIEYRAMREEGYDEGFSVAVTGSSSIIGPIIPPSVPLIIYGILAQVSIGTLFIAGLVPGLVMGVGLMILCSFYAHRNGYEKGDWWSLGEIGRTCYRALPALGTPALIIGGILGGWFTATEAGAVALFYTLIIGTVFYDGLSREELVASFDEGMTHTATLTFIVAAASLYGFLIRRAQLPEILAQAITGVSTDPLVLMLLIAGVLFIVGLMLETIAAITILTPVFLPIVEQTAISPIHFGVVMIVTLMIGLLTPPFGVILFVLNAVTGVSLERITRHMVPFYLPLLFTLLSIIVFPELVLWLPRAIGLA